MVWILIIFYGVLYLGLAAGGVMLLWAAYRFGNGQRLDLIRGYDRKPLPHAELIAKDAALAAAVLGVIALLIALMIPVLGIHFTKWHWYFGLFGGVAGLWRNVLLARHKRRSNGLPGNSL